MSQQPLPSTLINKAWAVQMIIWLLSHLATEWGGRLHHPEALPRCSGSSWSLSPGLQEGHFLRKWALKHCHFHWLCPSMVCMAWHQPEQWLWSNSFCIWKHVSVHTCVCMCVCVYTLCECAQRLFPSRNTFMGTFFLTSSQDSKQPLKSAPTTDLLHPVPPSHANKMGLSETPKPRRAACPLVTRVWGLTASLAGMEVWTHHLPQSLSAHTPVSLYNTQKTPTTFQDSVKTPILCKTFPNLSIHLPTSASRNDTTSYIFVIIIILHEGLPLLDDTEKIGPLQNIFVCPAFHPNTWHIILTKCLTSKWMHLSASKEFQALSGMKDTLKRKVLEAKGTLSHQGSTQLGGGASGSSKEHRDVSPHHVNTNHVEKGCS